MNQVYADGNKRLLAGYVPLKSAWGCCLLPLFICHATCPGPYGLHLRRNGALWFMFAKPRA